MVKSAVLFYSFSVFFWIRFVVAGEGNGGKIEFLVLFFVVCIYHDRF